MALHQAISTAADLLVAGNTREAQRTGHIVAAFGCREAICGAPVECLWDQSHSFGLKRPAPQTATGNGFQWPRMPAFGVPTEFWQLPQALACL